MVEPNDNALVVDGVPESAFGSEMDPKATLPVDRKLLFTPVDPSIEKGLE
jgi:hypothetical protein